MEGAFDIVFLARETGPADDPPGAGGDARFPLRPYSATELKVLFRGGEAEADECERTLARAARFRGATDVALAEGLHALRMGKRLAELGRRFVDYAREELGIGKRVAFELARLGAALPERPLLRAALRAGLVKRRAAELILPVAKGLAEAGWVEKASHLTVRALAAEVRRATATPVDPEEEWCRFCAQVLPEERQTLDRALELAGQLNPESTRVERLEYVLQEFLGSHPGDLEVDGTRPLGAAFRRLPQFNGQDRAAREAQLEAETGRWSHLAAVEDIEAPDVRFEDSDTAQQVHAKLKELAGRLERMDALIGHCASAIKRSGYHQLAGFGSFKQFCEERLGLSVRTVEQRAALEERIGRSSALQAARENGVGYEKLRTLSRLSEPEIAAWGPRAAEVTCITLEREVEAERDTQMRALGKVALTLPIRVATLLASACEVIRAEQGCCVSYGRCLAIVSRHFVDTWQEAVKSARTRSQKIRDRDGCHCQVPGCSALAQHAHHIIPRSHGGSDDPSNLVSLCAFHHLICVHEGHLTVRGRAPDGLVWELGGRAFDGRGWAPPVH